MLRVVCLLAVAALAMGLTVTPPELPEGYKVVSRANPSDIVKITISLPKTGLAELEKFILDVADPTNPQYGAYMSTEEVAKATAPKTSDVEAVADWLASKNVDFEYKHMTGDVIVTSTVAQAEEVFACEFSVVQHAAYRQTVLRATQYELPEEVAQSVSAVFGMHGLPLPPRKPRVGTPPQVTPAVINKAYGISGVKPAKSTNNRQAVAEFQGQLMNDTDLEVFFEKFLPDDKEDDKVYKFHGTSAQGFGIEAQLDIQFIMGVAPGILTEFYEQLNQDFCSDLKNWTSILLADSDPPHIHSVSYGWQGNLTQIGCTDTLVSDVDANFQKLAAAGVAIVFASGDSGSGYTPPQPTPCSTSDPGTKDTAYTGTTIAAYHIANNDRAAFECCSIAHEVGPRENYAGWTYQPGASPTGEGLCTIFSSIKSTKSSSGAVSAKAGSTPSSKAELYPSWPASSLWVTSVGATAFINDNVDNGEKAVGLEDHFGSGGGFSSFIDAPEWQKQPIEHYFQTVPASSLPPLNETTWNKGGRGTPDIAALGTGFAVVNDGQLLPGGVGGTSASAPTVSAIFSLLNEARIQAGKKALGYLNPFIYQNQDAFNDIVIGSDKWGRGGGTLPFGFNCTTGWDPVTGFGTPNFPKLLKAALAAP